MATTEERIRSTERAPRAGGDVPPDLDRLEELWRHPVRRTRPARRGGDPARALLISWTAVLAAVLALESQLPSAESVSVWADLVVLGFWVVLGAALYGLAQKTPWRLKASGAAAALGVVVGVACALTSHHPAALWGFEVAAFAALGAFSFGAGRS